MSQHTLMRSGLLLLMAALPAAAQAPQAAISRTTSGASATPHQVESTPPSSSPDHDRRAPRAAAAKRTAAINLDGRLDEAFWQTVPVIAELHQYRPIEGTAPTFRTEVRVAYDEEAIFVAARMFDDEPAKIVGRLSRRDNRTGSDHILIQFDPYHNHNGDVSFLLTPAGSRWDGGNGDVSWNPVWEGKAVVDSLGWTAEMRIPFSQLRFRPGSNLPWGFQVERHISRLNEIDVFSFWKASESGGPARWGHIEGIANPSRVPGRLELLPYISTQANLNGGEIDANDPFTNKREGTARVGADLKYQVTSTLTLSATINPDFGQAEVDPAVVNLSAFETFFDEKREFFIEGRDKFRFGSLWCFACSNASSLGMLATRRIGRSPQGAGLAFNNSDYADVPNETTILGAAKLSGRTNGGWNIGVLNAVTASEQADVRLGADRLTREVEPMTNYFVSRISRDLENGNLRVGGIFTSVARNLDDASLVDMLNKHSEGFGVDAEYWWKNRNYHLIAQTAFTNISGDPDAIARAQRSSARYFQRPDRDGGVKLDPAATSMQGLGSYIRMAKEGGDFRWETSLNVRSPGFENNDIATMSRADYVWLHGNINRRWTKPGKHYRSGGITFGGQGEYNYDGDLTAAQTHLSSWIELPNYWELFMWSRLSPQTMDDRRTRGGPVVERASERNLEYGVNTNRNKSIYFNIWHNLYRQGDGGGNNGVGASITWQPASNVSLTMGPRYNASRNEAQYVRTVDDATSQLFYGKRYVFSAIESKTLSMDTRLNITFTPSMSLQLFAQPYISSNAFSEWKEYAQPRKIDKLVYGRDIGTVTQSGQTVSVDPDGGGPAASFEFRDPDFTFRSLRGNAVFRWEYTPGSTLFLVWTQDRSSQEIAGDLDFGRDRRALFNSPANHVFLVKLNYWLPM
ncbi:MAG: DUF5916 domain-containing protein [Gemmatimonadota bacterium]